MSSFRVAHWLTAACAAVVLLPATAQAAPTITEYSSEITIGMDPLNLVAGSDGNVWFTENGNWGGVARVTPAGAVQEFDAGITDYSDPWGIAAGADGKLWFTESGSTARIGRITTSGAATEFKTGLTKDSAPVEIASGSDGNLWFTESTNPGRIGRITTAGVITEFSSGLTKNAAPWAITAGPDGNMWFTENKNAGKLGRITPQGVITEFATGLSSGTVQDITAGPDGNLWFTVAAPSPRIGRMTPQGVVTLFSIGLTAASNPQSITAGADGNVYFTEKDGPAIGQITPAGTITEHSVGLNSSSSPWGITTGADGRLWFSDLDGFGAVGRMTVGPGVTNVDASAVTDTTASVGTTVRPNSQPTTVSFEIGTTTAHELPSQSESPVSGSPPVAVSGNFTGLAPSTTYYVRMVATNATAMTYGPDLQFTTTASGAPVATTGVADGLSSSDATLHAGVNPNSGATTYHFEWGPTTLYGTSVPVADAAVGSDATDHALAQPLTGLQPNTTYHYRVVATGPSAVTNGLDEAFTTSAVAPLATTDPATAIGGTSARLSGTVNPRNSPADVRFEWGTAPGGYDSSADLPAPGAGGDGSDHAVSYVATGLHPNTTYYFRVIGLGTAGTTPGAERSFATDAVVPLATTGAADAVTDTAATLTATVNARNSTSTYRFQYGPTGTYGAFAPASNQAFGADAGDQAVSQALTGLDPATTYHFRVLTSNAAGSTAGADETFTTAPTPPPVGDPPAADPTADPTTTAPTPPPVGPPVAEIGRTVVVGATHGTVRVQVPGSTAFTVLDGASAVPSGSILDARSGTVALTTALDASGHTQRATFRGGVFQVRQTRTARGMTDITLRGGSFANCRPTPRARQPRAAAARRKPVRRLWGSDNHGRFRTQGRGSVATVRGTHWYTEDRCDGTLTRVLKGAVDVRDRRSGKTFRVRAGHSHLARV